MKIEATNSTFGNWIIWDGNTPHYFWRKSEAVAWLAKRIGLPGFADFRAKKLNQASHT